VTNTERKSKYNARAVNLDGYRFASQAEAARYRELKLLKQAGKIMQLVIHPRYPLHVGLGQDLIGYYEADFSYRIPGQRIVVEDVKGEPTPVYRLKKKLVRALYGIEIVEIDAAQYRTRTRSKR